MRLLLLEDDVMIGEAVLDLLRAEQYAVDWVKDGDSAESALRTQDYDLVLLDLSMPGMSGIEVNHALRESGAKVKVVLFTGYASGSKEAGPADGIIQKPFTADAIAREIRRVLG